MTMISKVLAGLLVAASIPVVGFTLQDTVVPERLEVVTSEISEPIYTLSPTGTISEVVAERLSSTTVSKSLTKDTWTLLFDDDNITDVRVLVTNNVGNAGILKFRILARSSANSSYVEIFSSPDVGVGLSWTSPLVASSYNRYRVEVLAPTTGTYSITYDDV